jgi:hypothetical protein
MINFATITTDQYEWLLSKKFEREGMVMGHEIHEVRKVLNLLSFDVDELRAMRNTVVRLLSMLEASYIDGRQYKDYMRVNDTKSGVVACIDQLIIDRFGEEV